MRTDGILVEAVLGDGDALDKYNRRLQITAYEARAHDNYGKIVTNELAREELERLRLARSIIVATSEAEQAKAYAEVFPSCTNCSPSAVPGSSNGTPTTPPPTTPPA